MLREPNIAKHVAQTPPDKRKLLLLDFCYGYDLKNENNWANRLRLHMFIMVMKSMTVVSR